MNWRTDLEAPYDEGQFTQIVAQAWREQPEATEVEVLAPLILRIKPVDDTGGVPTLSLHSLWNALRVDPATPAVWQVQRFLRHWLGIAKINFRLDRMDYLHVTPALRAGVAVLPDSLSVPVVGDLSLEFQMERGEHRFFLNQDHLRQMHLQQRVLKTVAFQNLGWKYGSRPTWYDHGEGVRAFGIGNTDYGSTLLADEGIWRSVRTSLNIHRVLASVPCQCHVFFADADNPVSIRRLVEKAEDVFNTSDSPLSPAIFVREYGTWQPWSATPLKAL